MNYWRFGALAGAIVLFVSPDARAQKAATEPAAAPTPAPPKKDNLNPTVARWGMTFYGFAQGDAVHDSTWSFTEGPNMNKIVRGTTIGGQRGRTQFSARNSRLGARLSAPEWNGFTASGVLEIDFFGNQGNPAYPPLGTTQYSNSEFGFYSNMVPRLRLAYGKITSEYFELTGGQELYLFGLAPYFLPTTNAYLSTPGLIYGREPQFTLGHMFKGDDISVDVTLGALRPYTRDGEAPDAEAAIRVIYNKWKGMAGHGAIAPGIDALQVGVSGVGRHFIFNPYSNAAATPTTNRVTEDGWGIHAALLAPIVPATPEDRSNALTLTGSFVKGTGIADFFGGLTGDYTWPPIVTPANPMAMPPTPATSVAYTGSNIDSGLVTYDPSGVSHTIDWMMYTANLQYYLPIENGKLLWVSGSYGHAESGNLAKLVPASLPATALPYDKVDYFDANLFIGFGGAAQVNFTYQYTNQRFTDSVNEINHRFGMSLFYIFL
jgi:hypothetical protein